MYAGARFTDGVGDDAARDLDVVALGRVTRHKLPFVAVLVLAERIAPVSVAVGEREASILVNKDRLIKGLYTVVVRREAVSVQAERHTVRRLPNTAEHNIRRQIVIPAFSVFFGLVQIILRPDGRPRYLGVLLTGMRAARAADRVAAVIRRLRRRGQQAQAHGQHQCQQKSAPWFPLHRIIPPVSSFSARGQSNCPPYTEDTRGMPLAGRARRFRASARRSIVPILYLVFGKRGSPFFMPAAVRSLSQPQRNLLYPATRRSRLPTPGTRCNIRRLRRSR